MRLKSPTELVAQGHGRLVVADSLTKTHDGRQRPRVGGGIDDALGQCECLTPFTERNQQINLGGCNSGRDIDVTVC